MTMFKDLRIKTGLRPGDFAEKAGIRYHVLYAIESGKSGASVEAKIKVLNTLNLLLGTTYTLENFEEHEAQKETR